MKARAFYLVRALICGIGLLAATGSIFAAGPTTSLPKPTSENASDPRVAQEAFTRAAQLVRTGASTDAITLIEQTLAKFPRDPQLRFLRAVIHVDAKEDKAAIAILERLTQDFPELPEPYNNLAVLHSQTGDYDAARKSLEDAVRALPGYPLAQQNLGDVYLQLAARAYEQAAKVRAAAAGVSIRGQAASPPDTSRAVKRLSLVRELIQKLEP